MVAMPYILVDIVLGILSVLFFSITSAALLVRYPSANRYLPARLRKERALAFIAQWFVLSVFSIAVVLVIARIRNGSIFSPFIFDLFFFLGLINSVVLIYQFLDKRYFLNTPKAQRRLLITILAVVMTSVPALAVLTAVVALFIIK